MILKVPFKKQNQTNTCGAACLEMVLRYFGVNETEEEIFKEISIISPESGRLYTRTAHLVHFAIVKDFVAIHSCLKDITDLDKLLRLKLPIIVLQRHSVNNESLAHFKVVIGLEGNSYIVHDPEIGAKQLISKEVFEKLGKKQPNGENTQDNLFILISPKKVDYKKFSFDPLQFRKCQNKDCPDPLQKNEPNFKCFTCQKEFINKIEGIPFGCPNQKCDKKYWLNYTCACGHKSMI